MAYYNQLCLLDARFVSPARGLGLLFHWYDSLTGVPAQQRSLAFEKGSVLFNIGALHTQIGARQDRSCPAGAGRAAEAFQSATGEGGRSLCPGGGPGWGGARARGAGSRPRCEHPPQAPSASCGRSSRRRRAPT